MCLNAIRKAPSYELWNFKQGVPVAKTNATEATKSKTRVTVTTTLLRLVI